MIKLLIILLIILPFETAGVILLSKGLKQLPPVESYSVAGVLRIAGAAITNRNVLLGTFFETIFFVGLLMMMSRGDVSFVWPLTSLTFVLATLAARFYLNEQVSGVRWSGVVLIMLGAALISWSEKSKHASLAAEPALVRPSSPDKSF